MLTNLASLIAKSISTNTKYLKTPQKAPLTQNVNEKSTNPFAQGAQNNPFLSTTFTSNASFHKNQPVRGGYFAGYINGKPNIVGQKLFIEA